MMFSYSLASSLLLLGASIVSAASSSVRLPSVHLGYETYKAAYYNETIDAFVFKNIRFAAPPVGNLRFELPQPPLRNRTAVQDGSIGNSCKQAAPLWSILERYPAAEATFAAAALGSLGSEDCLFLDVYVPRKVWESSSKDKVSVLAWIYGGGYVAGSKDSYPGNGLIDESMDNLIFVAMNYRLGMFGWMTSPSYLASGGVANLGLHDQAFALEWIQKHIHLFGGDKKRVTVVGESAGGGSIMHHITAYGGLKGNGSSPFAQAVPQSPGFVPISNKYDLEESYVDVLQIAGCVSNKTTAAMGFGPVDTGLLCLKNLSSTALSTTNVKFVYNASYGNFGFGPAVDGTYVPDLPGVLLAQGAYDHNLTLMLGHNSNEGAIFVPQNLNNTQDVAKQFTSVLTAMPQAVLNYLINVLYPSPSNETPYTTQYGRASLIVSEGVFTCNTNWLAHAFGNKTYNYLFSIPPGTHGQDIPYTFYEEGENATSNGVVNVTVAQLHQRYLTNFVLTGNPNKGAHTGLPSFPMYRSSASVMNYNVTDFGVVHDPTDVPRCKWWQKALFA